MTTLVTGAAGFIGAAACAALRAKGERVRALVRDDDAAAGARARARLEALGAELVAGDVADEASIERAARGADVAVHAAQRAPRGGTLAEHEAANLISAENALAACRRAGVRRFVFVSTEEVTAGDHDRPYVDEAFPHSDEFLSPYAETMALAEALVMSASGAGGMDTVALRPGWLWGPGDTVNLPDWVRRSRARTLALVGQGRNFVPTTYVDHLAAAIASAARAPAAAGNTYYVTDDERVTCRQFLTKVLAAVGARPPRPGLPYRAAYALAWLAEKTSRAPSVTRADVARLGRVAHFNVKRARDDLGYDPTVRIDEGARRLADWAREVGGADAIARGDAL